MKRDTQTPTSRVGRGGFTLVELMIAVGIIAILAAFLAPNVSTYMRRSMGQSTARSVSHMFQMARNQAMSRGEAILVRVNKHASGDNGSIEVLRTQNNDLDKCKEFVDDENGNEIENQDWEPRSTDCYALSCVQTSAFDEVQVAELDLETRAPDMIIAGLDTTSGDDTAVDSATLCFSPSGRVLTQTGTTFTSDCDAVNTRVFVTEATPGAGDTAVMSNPLGGSAPALDACLTSSQDADTKQQQKDGRDINNFFSIHVPYNGAVSVIQ